MKNNNEILREIRIHRKDLCDILWHYWKHPQSCGCRGCSTKTRVAWCYDSNDPGVHEVFLCRKCYDKWRSSRNYSEIITKKIWAELTQLKDMKKPLVSDRIDEYWGELEN